ncbi:Zinc-transporting ATPase [uncultured delta proteobacterium]|uniref:Zinc-transporting ATPase n=1 Tax=uncultured delta proteobacterium TaxID=34034 RepID=A0A212KBJ7_9DELT|nr:Zinc-transporting ATPase [uncultured delta proteobacterium]
MKTSACPCCAEDGGSCAVPQPRDAHDQDHGHEHGSEGMSPRQEAAMLVVSGIFFALVLVFEDALTARFGPWAAPLLFAGPYIACGWSVFKVAGKLILDRDVMNEFTLMAGATVVAVGLGQYAEAVGVMLFYRIGEFFQELASERSRDSIQSLLASKPSKAHVLCGDDVVTMDVEDVRAGDSVVIRAGESVPLDGVVVSGATHLDQSPLTGESVPVAVAEGDAVLGGSLNTGGVITVRATAVFADTHMARVLEMVQNAAKNKAPTERFMTRFARYYTPAVVALAALVAVLPPLVGGADWHTWIYRALVLLVISCPCALVISIPLSYFAGIGAASRKGILVKGGVVLDGLSHIKSVVFDKTGTLTSGAFAVTRIAPQPGVSEDELLLAAALAESESNHPVARAVMAKVGSGFTRPSGLVVEEVPGKGMRATAGGVTYLAGSARLLRDAGLPVPEVAAAGALVFIVRDGVYCGYLEVTDTVKPEAGEAVAALRARGLKTFMLSGDRREAVAAVAATVGVDGYEAELLPEGKVEALSRLADRETAAFVGDGINDAPILALSRVGIAMGGVGAEAAVEAADAVILNDSPAQIVRLFNLGDKVRGIVWQNIGMALGIKLLFMGLGICGLSGLWEAVFADVGVALLAVLNATRAMRV